MSVDYEKVIEVLCNEITKLKKENHEKMQALEIAESDLWDIEIKYNKLIEQFNNIPHIGI